MFTTKVHLSNNEYVLTHTGLWVRNFGNNSRPLDVNPTTSRKDYKLLISNEMKLRAMRIPPIDSELDKKFRKCLIISDGYNFEATRKILPDIPKDVKIIGVNRTLAKWKKDGELIQRKMDYFLANNPYKECLSLLPKHRYYPKCIISSKTNPDFANEYPGNLYFYNPVCGEKFATRDYRSEYLIDDYRNPICAAISIAYKFGVEKLVLLCCDNSFIDKRPSTEKLDNGLWMYPQHRIAHGLIEGNLYWLTHQKHKKIYAANCSDGLEYKEIQHIGITNIVDFFEQEIEEDV